MTCRSIQINCPLCGTDEQLESPEVLCGHLSEYHDIHPIMQSKTFESFALFQIWLSMVEETRCDGGYLGSSQGPCYEDEYYLLCRRPSSTTTKRRRMSEEVCPNIWTNEEVTSYVTCCAFVHVFEGMDGRITVRYCLDHCGHSSSDNPTSSHSNRKRSSSNTLKRSSPCSSIDNCGETCTCEYQPSSIASSPSSSVDFDTISEEDDFDRYTVSDMNMLISQRLDNTANRLKTLTKVLADLAVDIRNSN